MNRKGFTLVELLVTIAIIGIVLSLGTYFVMEVVENSKEKSFEATKKSVLESAVIYANEFLDETDWVPSNDEGDTDRACVSVQWLINKGYVKKEDFEIDDFGIEKDKYKVYTNDVVVIEKDTNTKTIRFDNVYGKDQIKIGENGTCKNLLNVEITSISSTTRSITVNANCSVKGVVPSDIKYEFNIGGKTSGKIESNTFTYGEKENEGLVHGSEYDISVKCISDEFGGSEAKGIGTTNTLPTPSITLDDIYVTINFGETNSDVTKKYTLNNIEGVKLNSELGYKTLSNGNNTTENQIVKLSTANIKADVEINAENYDGYNTSKASPLTVKYEPKVINININKPSINASDNKLSGKWHNKNFSLSINSDNSNSVKYYYGTNENKIDIEYSAPISIEDETNSITYFAKACNSENVNNCSGTTSYEVKLDETAPDLDIEVKNIINNNTIDLVQNGNKYSYDNWIKAKLNFKVDAYDSLSGLSSDEVAFRYSQHDMKNLQSLSYIDSIDNNSTRAINNNGNRQYQFEICDIAGNCTTKDYYIKTDITPPELNAIMSYSGVSGGTNLISCSGNVCNNDDWLNKYVTLYFKSNDPLSGLNNKAKFAYNYGYLSSQNEEILGTEDAIFNNGSFIRNITSDGARYITLNICDKVDNCTEKKIYFKIDTISPVISINKNGNSYSIACRPSFSGLKTFAIWDSNNYDNNKEITEPVMTYNPSNSNNVKISLICKNNAQLVADEKYEYTSSSGSSGGSSSGGSSSGSSSNSCDPLADETCCKLLCRNIKSAKFPQGFLNWEFTNNKCYCCEEAVTGNNAPITGRCFAYA